MLHILKLGNPVLSQQCAPVTEFNEELKKTVEGMFEAMEKADGVGLAAPQVGIPKRFFVIEIKDEVRRAFINPQIMQTSMDEVMMEEGCLSVPGVYREVKRPRQVTVQAQDVDGKPFTVTADGLYGRCIQHEYDHLNGVLFIDHLDEVEKEQAVKLFKRKNRFGRNK